MNVLNKTLPAVRLDASELETIRGCFQKHFTRDDHIWIFGSRVIPEKKGGDIDLYVEIASLSAEESLDRKLNFLVDLKSYLGDQKIDVVLNHLPSSLIRPIYQEARKNGILLI